MDLSEVVTATRNFSIWDDERRLWLGAVVQDAVNRASGDLVECGVSHGGTAVVLGHALLDTTRHLWLYDSFQGMPVPDLVRDGVEAERYTGLNKTDEAEVFLALRTAGVPAEQVIFCTGMFTETFKQQGPAQVAALHIDTDWYDNVYLCLSRWVPWVQDGGVVVLDAYGHWRGCRQALHDWLHDTKADVVLQRGSQDQVYWIAGPVKQCGT